MKSLSVHLLLLLCAGCGPAGIYVDSGTDSGGRGSATETETEAGTDPEPEPDPSDTSSDSSDTSTDSGTTSGSGFVPLTDLATCGGSCDPWIQDCPEGEKCVPYASSGGNWDSNKCVPVLGEQTSGESCTYAGMVESTDDCDATSFCFGVEEVDGELIGNCHGFCQGTPDTPECPDGFVCPIANDGSISLCIEACDPILQDCSNGEGCYWGTDSFICISTLVDPGIPDGQPCGYINDCMPGSMCATAEVLPECNGSACCSPFCDLGVGNVQCEGLPGTSCLSLFEEGMAPQGYDHLGLCILGL
jgi:hypothetical protein